MRRALFVSILLHLAVLGAILRLAPRPAPSPPEPLVVELVARAPEPEEVRPAEPVADPVATAPRPPRVEAAPPPAPAPPKEARPEPAPTETLPPPAAEATAPDPTPSPAAPPAEAAAPEVPPPPAPRATPAVPTHLAQLRPAPRPAPPKAAATPARKTVRVPAPPGPRPVRAKPVRVAEAKRRAPDGEVADVQAEDDFEALLRSVERLERRARAERRREGRGRDPRDGRPRPAETEGDADTPTPAQLALLQRLVEEQVYRCWTIPPAARGLGRMRVLLRLEVTPDGRVQRVEIVDRARFERDPRYRTVAESAIRAVRRCAPLRLPREQYAVWRSIEMNFDVARALSG